MCGRAKHPSGQGKLSASEMHRLAFEGSTDGIVVFDGASGAIWDANPAAIALYGYEPDAFRQLTLDDLCAPAGSSDEHEPEEEAESVVPLFQRH